MAIASGSQDSSDEVDNGGVAREDPDDGGAALDLHAGVRGRRDRRPPVTRTEEFEKLRLPLFAIAFPILDSVNEAEHAVQETWLRLEASPTNPRRPGPFSRPR